MRFIVICLLIAIVISLGSALVFVFRDQEGQYKDRAVKALTLRVGLSVLLFLLLIGGQYFGVIGQRL